MLHLRVTFLTVFLPGFPPVFPRLLKDLSVTEDFSLNVGNGFVQNGFLQLTFPDDDEGPALGFQLTPYFLVAFLIAGNLGRPEFCVGLGN